MSITSRRNLLKVAAASSVASGLAAQDEHGHGHGHEAVAGRRANATVSFGQWKTDPPLDRFSSAAPITANNHQLIPNRVTIRAGGSVNFIIAGFHHILVYDDGTQPANIDVTSLVPGSAPPLINDPRNRIYRGFDPRTQPTDRVEVVRFAKPGTFFVTCGVLPHFRDGMFGFVRVLPADSD